MAALQGEGKRAQEWNCEQVCWEKVKRGEGEEEEEGGMEGFL